MQLTYIGEINGVITQRNRVLNRFKIHNGGLVGIQYLFAYAASNKQDLVAKYLPNNIRVYHDGSIVSKQPIKISGLRYELMKSEEGDDYNVPSACFDFAITAEDMDGEYSVNDLVVRVFNSSGVGLAEASMSTAQFESEDPPTLKAGLQVNASWRMYIKGGTE